MGMTINELIRAMGDIAGRFDISADEARIIAEHAIEYDDPEAKFVSTWENEAWWTDAE